jgi:hypothetical protein
MDEKSSSYKELHSKLVYSEDASGSNENSRQVSNSKFASNYSNDSNDRKINAQKDKENYYYV